MYSYVGLKESRRKPGEKALLSITEVRTHQKSSRDVFHLDGRHKADTELTIVIRCDK